jgi:transposase
MDSATGLTTATREELLAVIAAQQQTIATQQQAIGTLGRRIAELERRLGSSGGKGMPGTKPAATTRSKATGQPRKRRDRGYARLRSARPTHRVVHAADRCPACATPLHGGRLVRTREVIDLPAGPVQVVQHRVIARRCPRCRRAVTPALDLSDAVVGKQRLGIGLVSLIVTLREVGRLPVRTIQWYLRVVHGLILSVGAITAASDRVARAGQAALDRIRASIRAAPVVHLDETGWRQNGVNGYVWAASTPTARYFVRGSRTGAMVETILGEHTAGVLCCDGYAGYHHYPGRKQRCWTHILREVHDLRRLYPQDTHLADWATDLKHLYADAVAFRDPDPPARAIAQRAYEERLAQLCAPAAQDQAAVQGRLARTLLRHLPERFVFVADPHVPPDNNAAERSLRHLVTSRKISGGTRSPQGTTTKLTLASLLGTAQLRGLDPLLASASLLTSGRL